MAHDRKVAVYIDGFNLYHAIDGLNRPQLKWLNLATLARSFVRQNEVLAKCHYFTSISMWNPDKAERHTAYIAALEAYGVQCSLGVFKQSKRFCREQKRTCSFTEEKRTDVALAVNVVADAMKHVFDRLVLITADTDQIPTI